MSDASFERARAIAEAVREAGGRALIVGGWVRDRLMGRQSPKDIDLEVFRLPADRVRALLEGLGRVEAVGESFQVYKTGDIDVSLPRRESKSGRGHRGLRCHGRSGDDDSTKPRGGATSRINAIAWDPLTGEYLDPFDGRGDLATPSPARRRPRDASPTTACARCAPFSSPPASSSRSTTTRASCAGPLRSTTCRPNGSGVKSRSCSSRRGRPSASRWRWTSAIVARLFPELHALVGCPQEPEWHPEGDVWVHTLQVVDQARTRIDDLAAAAAAGGDARRRVPRLRQARDDRGSSTAGSDRSITRSRASRRRWRSSIA